MSLSPLDERAIHCFNAALQSGCAAAVLALLNLYGKEYPDEQKLNLLLYALATYGGDQAFMQHDVDERRLILQQVSNLSPETIKSFTPGSQPPKLDIKALATQLDLMTGDRNFDDEQTTIADLSSMINHRHRFSSSLAR